jgi:hypothetical protein
MPRSIDEATVIPLIVLFGLYGSWCRRQYVAGLQLTTDVGRILLGTCNIGRMGYMPAVCADSDGYSRGCGSDVRHACLLLTSEAD